MFTNNLKKLKEIKVGDKRLGDFSLSDLNLKCRVGRHDWGEWGYLSQETCHQERSCQNPQCEATETREAHLWTDWEFEAEKSCHQTRTCIRCEHSERQEDQHDWEFSYEAPNSCKQVITCTRCGEQKTGMMAALVSSISTKHTWSKWEHESDTSCVQHRTCERCGEQESQQLPHTWSQWTRTAPNECHFTRTCQRCQTRDEDRYAHEFGEWQRMRHKSCDHIRTCACCGTQELQSFHKWCTVQHNLETEDIALKRYLSLIIHNGGKPEEVAVVEDQYRTLRDESFLFGSDERVRTDRSKIIFRLESLGKKYSVNESFSDLKIQIQIVFDDAGQPYLYDKSRNVTAQAYCSQCGLITQPMKGG